MQLHGCGTALVTPFHQDGSLDDTALRNLVSWQIESGIDFLVPCGTTGETPTLTRDEWLHVIDTTIEVVAGRVPIIAGATSNATHEAVDKAKELASRPGVSAILTASLNSSAVVGYPSVIANTAVPGNSVQPLVRLTHLNSRAYHLRLAVSSRTPSWQGVLRL